MKRLLMGAFTRIALLCLWSSWSLAAPLSQPTPQGIFDGRIFSASTDAPFAMQFRNDPDGKAALVSVVKFLTTERNKLERRLTNWVYGISTDENPCNHEPSRKFAEAVNNSMAKRGFGMLFRPCVAQIKIDLNSSMERSLFDYFGAVDRLKTGFLSSLQEILTRAGRDWNKAYTFSSFSHVDEFQNCALSHLTAFFVGGKWALSADITNAPPNKYLEDYKRFYLAENIYLDNNNQVRSLKMTSIGYPERVRVDNATTTFSNWDGAPSTSRFTDVMTPGRNPAILEAISARVHLREQAEDSLTSSNIAIMLLPLGTALIPIASIAEVNKFTAFGYLLITDVAMILPLAIKGVELILFSQQRQESTMLRIYGATSIAKNGTAELWHAKCGTQGYLRYKGILFLTIAICIMIIGIVLEIVSRARLCRRKLVYLKLSDKNGDVVEQQLWEKYGSESIKCDCCEGKLFTYPPLRQTLGKTYDSARSPDGE